MSRSRAPLLGGGYDVEPGELWGEVKVGSKLDMMCGHIRRPRSATAAQGVRFRGGDVGWMCHWRGCGRACIK